MATDVDQAYYGWPHDELPDGDRASKLVPEVSVSQMLDHGSVSFGRFAVESLSWEKRSVFTYNKCQEELEKVKNPGLVAQKKAYFEEYYKKLRALKAMQENQQTELTLEYDGDGSISSHTGEEEETMGQSKSYGNIATNLHNVLSEGTMIAPLEKERVSSKASQTGHLDPESALPCHDLFTRNLKEAELVMHTSNDIQRQHLDTDSSVGESLLRSTKVILRHDIIELEDEGMSRKYEDSMPDVRIEVGAQGTAASIVAPAREDQNTATGPKNYKQGDLDVPANNHAPNKKSTVGQDANCISSTRVKELTVSARNGLKVETRMMSDKGKTLQRLKHPIHKTTGKIERNIGSCTAASNKVSTNNRTAAVPHRRHTEERSNATIPLPFSLGTKRRAAASENKSDAKGPNTKIPNRLASSLNQAKGVLNAQCLQGSFKKTASSSAVKSKGHENKRNQEVQGKTLACNSQNLKGRSVLVLGQQKARSINLPAHNISNPTGGIEHKLSTAIGQNRQKESKEDFRSRESSRVGTKIMSSQNGNLRPGNKKFTQAGQSLTKPDGKKLLIGNTSIDGKKPKQPMPRWR
ncbi:hypothetical protein J5N97_012696 [Dioscorea zingiberensis]|uniref:Protein WVD2-like 7 n=1 Tax=Dioscorea zingiberensis TaxID=325984 RepID=A0A9D5HIC6_9LILI|nr:hypothetical protein J5N97_012696 [Dioscorea zingiberensis]